MAQENTFTPLQQTQFAPEDFAGDTSALNQFFSQLVTRVNNLGGAAGPTQLPNGLDLSGSGITNVNGVGPQHAALSAAQAESQYSPAVMSKKLDAGGSHALRGVRHLNSDSQQEKSSTFLDSIMHTVPTSNSATISGSGGDVSVSAGYHYYPGGRVVGFASRSDSFSLPASVAISTIARSNGIVTANTTAAVAFAPGSVQIVQGVQDATFDGEFVIRSSPTSTSFTYAQVAPDVTSTGGTVGGGGVYYYYLENQADTLSVAGPYSADTQENRIAVNKDGSVLIAVAFLSPKGFDPTQSAAGATPPAQTNGNRLINRL